MAGELPQSKTGRKLSRAQVQEILERNCRLYKDENTFVPYLVELAMYLLEYEYDWADSGAAPPKFAESRVQDLKKPLPAAGAPAPSISDPLKRNMRQISTIKPRSLTPRGRVCPHCGQAVGDELLCPHCQNMTR